MADEAVLARPYAQALYYIYQDEPSQAVWQERLETLAGLSQNPAVLSLLVRSDLNQSVLCEILQDMADSVEARSSDFPHKDYEKRFLELLLDYNRFGILSFIHEEFHRLCLEGRNELEAEIVAAHYLNDDELSRLTEVLCQHFGRQIKLIASCDPSLIGGAVIKVGDKVIDGSARGQLKRLSRFLT